MADLFLSALIPIVMEKSADSLMKKISQMWGIADERERLCIMLRQIKAVLLDAEEKANSNDAVKSWLENLKSATYDADDLLDEFCYEELRRDAVSRGHKVGNFRALFSLENPALFRYKMSEKLKNVVGRVDILVSEMQSYGFVPGPSRQVSNKSRTDSLVVESKIVGRDDDKEKVVQLLLKGCESDDLMVVPIVGMGGLGKTALAKLVYNDSRVKEYFNLPLWVCVSEEFNIGHIVKSIIDLVEGGCNIPIDNMEMLQRRLRQVLSGKRYVLVLDDVWNENVDEWERLRAVLDYGGPGNVIIVTTRSGRVATIMGTVDSYNLRCLGEKDSWSLFHKRAFSTGVKESQELVEIGRKMVQNCRGLPLAINALGSLMSFKSEAREWLAILEESRIWEQQPTKDNVLPVLRLSYNHLPSFMKQCFAFCAIYPKDYEMDKDKLIKFWMANGFIPSDGSISFEMKGSDTFNELVWRSFFQEVRQVCPLREGDGHYSETKCKMHDLMHDLAQSLMGTKCLSTLEVPAQLNQAMIDVRHISVRTLPGDINKAIDCFPSIRSLISSYDYPHLVKNIGFVKSNSLRILELYVQPVKKTFITPEKMKHLRYLELSIRDISTLPEAITTLYLLQTLKLLNGPFLEKLPEGTRYMSSLRHLNIFECYRNLKGMPEGLGQLSCLQTLTTYVVGTDVSNGIRELKKLNNLHGQLHLYNLREIKNVVDAREANLMAKQNLDHLALCWGMKCIDGYHAHNFSESNASEVMHCDHFEVLNALKPCNKLKVLQIAEYRGEKFPVWMTEYQMLENLIELYLIACRDCTRIPPIEKLPFLRILKLQYFNNLGYLCNSASTSAECSENARVSFPSLKSMELSGMRKLCSWYEGELGNKSCLIFPELKTLEINYCPKLTAMPIVPSLMSMSVSGNKHLSRFATGLTTLHKLSLEGSGENESLSFQPWESLNELHLSHYNSIVPVGVMEGDVSITSTKCQTLGLWNVSIIPSTTSLWFWKCFIFLKNMNIFSCDTLIYWPEDEFRNLNCLREIGIYYCSNFLGSQLDSSIGRSTTEVLLPILQTLNIIDCPNFTEIPKCSTSLENLWIRQSQKLQCIPEWLGSLIALKELKIQDCDSLNSLPQSIGGLVNLEELSISRCPNLACLPEGMEGLKALEKFWIRDCPKIMVFPDGLLQGQKNLKTLWIVGCPRLERHFGMFGKYRHLISEIQFTQFGEERRSGILKDLTMSFPSCKLTCFSARS